MNGDYARTLSGLSHETFIELTGAPSFQYFSNDENIWERLCDAED